MRDPEHPVPSSRYALRFQRLLWVAFVWSLGIYLILFLLLRPAQEEVPMALVASLAAAAFGCAVAAVLVRRAAAAASQGRRPDLARRRLLDLVTYGLTEAIAVCGLVLGFLGGRLSYFLPFLVASLVGFLLLLPRTPDYPQPPPAA